MSNLFISESDEIVISFVIGTDKKGQVFADTDRESMFRNNRNLDKDIEIEDHEIVFKKPSFGDIVNLNKSFTISSSSQSLDFNPWELRYARMRALLKRWSFKNRDGEDIAPDPNLIDSLNPVVANLIGSILDDSIGTI